MESRNFERGRARLARPEVEQRRPSRPPLGGRGGPARATVIALLAVLASACREAPPGGGTEPAGAAQGPRDPAAAEPRAMAGDHVSAGAYHTCAISSSGAVECWGSNSHGQLGVTPTPPRPVAAVVAGVEGPIASLAAGGFHTCALATSGKLSCWGQNRRGQLVDGTRRAASAPRPAAEGERFSAIAAGWFHTCGIAMDGHVECAGDNASGQLGADGPPRPSMAIVPGVTEARALARGGHHTCAIVEGARGGNVRCWGNSASGQLGADGSGLAVRSITVDAVSIAAGERHTCAILSSGRVVCWGDGTSGQLGDGTATALVEPTVVTGIDSGVVKLALGGSHSCALTAAGAVACWGSNAHGQLGGGAPLDGATPQPVSGLPGPAIEITAGVLHTCAMLRGGEIWCWGGNTDGQLGDGTTANRAVPVAVKSQGAS